MDVYAARTIASSHGQGRFGVPPMKNWVCASFVCSLACDLASLRISKHRLGDEARKGEEPQRQNFHGQQGGPFYCGGADFPSPPTPPTVKWPAVLAMEVCEVRFFAFPALVFRAVVWNVGACQITTKRTNTNCDGRFSLRVSFQVRGARGPF